MARIGYVTIDSHDVEAQRSWWAEVLGYTSVEGPWALLRDPEGKGVTLYFQEVPQPKTVKNRIHLDLVAADPEAEAQRLVGLGATHVRDVEEGELRWAVLQDREGNEFCLFPAPGSQAGMTTAASD